MLLTFIRSVAYLRTFAFIVTLFGGVTAWSANIPPNTHLAQKQSLRINVGIEPESLDPSYTQSLSAHTIVHNLFEGLTAINNHGQVVPGVAYRWEQTEPNTWIFYLRPTATWSNGKELTAHDFVYGMRRLVDPITASVDATSMGGFFLHALQINEGKLPTSALGVRALDNHTLQIKTAYPVPFLPELLTNPNFSPLPQATITRYKKDWVLPKNMVNNGPYLLKQWKTNDKIKLVKNPHYWDHDHVIIHEADFLFIDNAYSDIKQYESGQNDWVKVLPPGTYQTYKEKHPQDIKNAPMIGVHFYSLNHADPIMRDIRVRKALSMVIDRETLAEKITADGQKPAYSLIVDGVKGSKKTTYVWASWPMEERITEAQRLLAEAKVVPGQILKLAYNNSEYHKKVAIFIAAEWKEKLGLELQFESMEFKVLLNKRDEGSYQLLRNARVGPYNDATSFLSVLECESSNNPHHYCNPIASEKIKAAHHASSETERHALLTEALRLMMGDYPVIPLLQYSMPRLVKPYVGGYTDQSPMDLFRLKDLYLIDQKKMANQTLD
jgi:oligopeptide transport system substrate-binding protein